jgi:hypothetical protein
MVWSKHISAGSRVLNHELYLFDRLNNQNINLLHHHNSANTNSLVGISSNSHWIIQVLSRKTQVEQSENLVDVLNLEELGYPDLKSMFESVYKNDQTVLNKSKLTEQEQLFNSKHLKKITKGQSTHLKRQILERYR